MLDEEKQQSEFMSSYLVGIQRKDQTRQIADEHLEELVSLVETLGAPIIGQEMANLNVPNAKFLLGSGKAEEIIERAKAENAEMIIIDDDLSPAQQRNWERASKLAVIDRREIILDIFAQRAQTKEARLQVDLARMQYSLPRLKRAWTHLERQRGGRGFIGGAGEAQIEVDRRIVRDRIAQTKVELEQVRKQRATQRKSRKQRPTPTAALVGYTNSGKSSILNKLTGASVLAEDKLFATLDPTTRRIELPHNQPLLLSDTVGFIRKLPHNLVEAFKATLEEAQVADFLIHVLDVSHAAAKEHLEATHQVLAELKLDNRPCLYVLNKVDLVTDPLRLSEFTSVCEPYVITSVKSGEGIEDLRNYLSKLVTTDLETMHLRIPSERHDLVSFVHREGVVKECKYQYDGVYMIVDLPLKHVPTVNDYLLKETDEIESSPGEI